MAVTVVIPPTREPVDIEGADGAKAHLRVDGIDEDGQISAIITAAREFCEDFQARAFVTQTLELTLDAWPAGSCIKIPRPPLQSVVSVTYTDKDGVDATWDPSNYVVDAKSQPGRIALAYGKSWPSVTLQPVNGVTIRYVAGYGDAAKVPKKIRQAMLLLVGHWNEHREAVLTGTISKEIELAATALLNQGRIL